MTYGQDRAAVSALPTPPGFDYAILDPAVADEARAAADRIRTRTRAAYLDVGRDLLAIKEQVERGQFINWVEQECGINIRTAQRAIRAAQLVAKYDNLSYLPQDGLLALTARSTPAAVIPLLIDKIEQGERPTVAEIKEEIAAHGLKRPPKTCPAHEPPNVVEDANALERAISAVKALSAELRAEFERWFRQTYSHGQGAILNGGEILVEPNAAPLPAQSPANGGELLPALDALPRDDYELARKWVLHGAVVGDEPPPGRAEEFCALYVAASDEERRRFRSQLIARTAP